MKVTSLAAIPASIPYRHREQSSQVNRDGVTEIMVRIETDDGLVGWGESCSGSDTASIKSALDAMRPFVLGCDPWQREALRAKLYHHGLWQFRAPTANFAFAGIDMALWDLCGKSVGQPLYRLLGGAVRDSVTYFYYLHRGTPDELSAQCAQALAAGYSVFYLKVGLDEAADLEMVQWVRQALGPEPVLRLDANGAWSYPQALRMLGKLEPLDIDFVEQPVREYPVGLLAELRRRAPIRICANEGMWSIPQAYERIRAGQADVYCFSQYWVGSLSAFQLLARAADLEGAMVCKHTHGEFGLAAAAAHHVMLTLDNAVEGNQQTAAMNEGDILTQPLPISAGPSWGLPKGAGLGIEVDEQALASAAERYQRDGQFLPYQPELLGLGP